MLPWIDCELGDRRSLRPDFGKIKNRLPGFTIGIYKSDVFPILESLAAFLPEVGDFETNAVGIGKEDGVVVVGVFRVELRSRASDVDLAKLFCESVDTGGILHSETEMVQSGSQGIVMLQIVGGPQNESKMTVVILDVLITLIGESVLAETEDWHQTIVKVFGSAEVRDGDVDVVDSDDLNCHSSPSFSTVQ